MGYCATWQEHQRDVAEAIEERDAEWLAAVEEMEEYNIVGPNNDEYSLGVLHGWERAFRELKARMQK